MAEAPDVPDGSFLSRWSRRKVQARTEPPLAKPGSDPAPLAAALPQAGASAAVQLPPAAGLPEPGSVAPETTPAKPAEPPLPTMEDVARLTKDSDYSVFTRGQVDPQVRNAALKKLFHAEPQFNVMDGLDVYIDDYNKADPLPLSMLRQMQAARVLGLLDDELVDQDKPPPDTPSVPPVDGHTANPDEDADLQLQPHDAAGRADAGPGPDEPADGNAPPDRKPDVSGSAVDPGP